jgi:large subunit ribosomal protein L21e
MVQRSTGIRVNTRQKFRRNPRDRGLSPITRALQEFEVGEKANIVIDPSIHGGQPHHRFHGQTGEVIGKQGNSFLLKIKDGNKPKTLIVRPEHLRRNVK